MSDYFKPVADLHTHTLASPHAYSTLTENATAAAALGMMAIACTDHGPKVADGMHPWHFGNMRILPDHIAGIRHLRGVEANICDFDGTLDLSDARLNALEIVIASMHQCTMPFGTKEEISAAWIAVAKNPLVDIIGHCGTPEYAFDYEAVIPVFGQYGKVVEINEGTFRVRRQSLAVCKHVAELCMKHGVRVAVNSDAHYHEHVGRTDEAVALLGEIGFPKELIINSSKERFEAFLKEKQVTL
ncbi:MAG: phosphatase [Kiritimatiellae bacterium]|nr:phosphatase [Kiritimatiellia bacterium]